MQLAVYPADIEHTLEEALTLAGVEPIFVTDADLEKPETVSEWSAILIDVSTESMRRLRVCRRLFDDSGIPVLLVVAPDQASLLDEEQSIADFLTTPVQPAELRTRIRRIVRTIETDDDLTFRDLTLNTATYQATISDVPVDLTYMEYELLRFFVEHQGRVWSREQLLSKVWGYDYYGGARTVDVHVRRLRSKMGEERADWVTTVRSVGYRFG